MVCSLNCVLHRNVCWVQFVSLPLIGPDFHEQNTQKKINEFGPSNFLTIYKYCTNSAQCMYFTKVHTMNAHTSSRRKKRQHFKDQSYFLAFPNSVSNPKCLHLTLLVNKNGESNIHKLLRTFLYEVFTLLY